MNPQAYEAAAKLISSSTYVQQGRDARKSHEKQIQILLEQVSRSKMTQILQNTSVYGCVYNDVLWDAYHMCWHVQVRSNKPSFPPSLSPYAHTSHPSPPTLPSPQCHSVSSLKRDGAMTELNFSCRS